MHGQQMSQRSDVSCPGQHLRVRVSPDVLGTVLPDRYGHVGPMVVAPEQ